MFKNKVQDSVLIEHTVQEKLLFLIQFYQITLLQVRIQNHLCLIFKKTSVKVL